MLTNTVCSRKSDHFTIHVLTLRTSHRAGWTFITSELVGCYRPLCCYGNIANSNVLAHLQEAMSKLVLFKTNIKSYQANKNKVRICHWS